MLSKVRFGTPFFSENMKNVAINHWCTRTSAVVTLAILCGCGQNKDSQKDARAKQLDPVQAACIEGTLQRRIAQDAEFVALRTEALTKQHSSIDITLAQRRANEKMCLEFAQCFAIRDSTLNSIMVSTMFDSCLKDVDRES